MKRWCLNIFAVASLALCVITMLAWMLVPRGDWILFDGGGGYAHGSSIATYVLFIKRGSVGIGWTHSDGWFDGTISLPFWILAIAFAILPLLWLWRRTRPTHKPGAFPVQPNPTQTTSENTP